MTDGPRRRPATGGYVRGDEKQARIIAAALRRFGEDGYDGASTRQIAADAGVNPPALQYYFGGKEGLFLACGAHIAERFSVAMKDSYDRAQGLQEAPQAALEVLCDIMDAVAEFIFDTAQAEGFSRLLARSMNNDGGGPRNEVLGRRMEDELHGHCVLLVGFATGQPADAEDTRLRTIAVTGQLTAFLFGHEDVLRRLGWPDVRGPRLGRLKAVLRAHAFGALGAPLPASVQAAPAPVGKAAKKTGDARGTSRATNAGRA